MGGILSAAAVRLALLRARAGARSRVAMATLKNFLLIGAAIYLALVAVMYLAQRSLMYFPETLRTSPAQVGLREAEEVTLDTADGERVIAWHIPPRGDRKSTRLNSSHVAISY